MTNSTEPISHDLFDFMIAATNEMSSEYSRIQRRVRADPGTAGDQGEENWAKLLRGWIPPAYHVVTKGRILSHTGSASNQIDVLILTHHTRLSLLTKNYTSQEELLLLSNVR